MTTGRRRDWIVLAALAASGLFLYRSVLAKLVYDWANDGNYSHGFIIAPVAGYFVWERRHQLSAIAPAPSNAGLLVILTSLLVLVVGVLGAELFLARISMIGALVGTLAFLRGWRFVKAIAFPLAFLVLMIPIPAILFNQVALPLQLIASRLGETVLTACSVPVLREGNVITLANTKLEVAEACSGIRSLVSLLTLALVYGHFADPRRWVRFGLAVGSVPIAIVTNGARVAGTGLAAHYYGPQAAQGFLHEFSGWVVFLAAFGLMFIVVRLLGVWLPSRPQAAMAAS